MASNGNDDQQVAVAAQTSTNQTSQRPRFDSSQPKSLINYPEGGKFLKSFPPPWSPLPPPDVTLRQICEAYPNHLEYEGLNPFIQYGWSADQIYKAIPMYIRDRIKKEQISKAKDQVTMYAHRRDRQYIALGGKDGVKTLWEGAKLRDNPEGYGRAITFGLNPHAPKPKVTGKRATASSAVPVADNNVGETPTAADTINDEEDGARPPAMPDVTDSEVVMENADTTEAGDPTTGSTIDEVGVLPPQATDPQENAEHFLRTEQERYQYTRLMGEPNWEGTTTLLASGRGLADAVDGDGEPMHPFLQDQMFFGDN